MATRWVASIRKAGVLSSPASLAQGKRLAQPASSRPILLVAALVSGLRDSLPDIDQRSIDEVLTQEPRFKFVGAKYVTNDHVVGPSVSEFVRTLCQFTALPDNDLMRVQQPRDHYRHFFPAPRRTLDLGGFSDIVSHGYC